LFDVFGEGGGGAATAACLVNGYFFRVWGVFFCDEWAGGLVLAWGVLTTGARSGWREDEREQLRRDVAWRAEICRQE